MSEEHVIAFEEFDAALPEEDVLMWTTMVHAWEKAQTKEAAQAEEWPPNPFKAMMAKIMENAVHLE
ncbi:hypothetical protein C0995_001354 [Termitomyces sp. Mi166|nr:hypothetical protein C0995_001354 [Termitomyces sp. Mi166\